MTRVTTTTSVSVVKRELPGGVAALVLSLAIGDLCGLLGAPFIVTAVLVGAIFWAWVAQRRKARERQIVAPVAADPGRLQREAHAARRHAEEYGLPTAPWAQLEGFWVAAGDVDAIIDELQPVGGAASDPFMEEFRGAMLAPLGDDGSTSEPAPFDLEAFVRRTSERLRRENPAPLTGVYKRTPATDRIADSHEQRQQGRLDAEVERYRQRHGQPSMITTDDINNEIGRLEQELAASNDPDPVVRCTWALTGTAEDDHAIRALRRNGVKVAIETTDVKRAHLAGPTSAVRAARAEYAAGFKQRTSQGKIA